MAEKVRETVTPEQQKKTIVEETWLKYYNQVLFEKGIITERERNLMIHKIDARTARSLYHPQAAYRNLNGNKIAHSTMSNMISNPKYKGYYVGNKVKVVDMFTKKQKSLPPEEWVMFKDETGEIVPAIVSEEVWDRATRFSSAAARMSRTGRASATMPIS